MVRSPPDRVSRHPSSPAVIPWGGVEVRSARMGRHRRNSSQYISAATAKAAMGTSSGLPSRI